MNDEAGELPSQASSSSQQSRPSSGSETSVWSAAIGDQADASPPQQQHHTESRRRRRRQPNKRPASELDEDSQPVSRSSLSDSRELDTEEQDDCQPHRPLAGRAAIPSGDSKPPVCGPQLGGSKLTTTIGESSEPNLEQTHEIANLNDSEQQRRFRPQKYCAVCGDKAIACNFNAVTCESCKAFFRRNAFKEQRLRCLFENRCIVDRVTRRFCSKCRLLKCFAIGMKREWILTDEQKQIKRVKIMQNKQTRQQQHLVPGANSAAAAAPSSVCVAPASKTPLTSASSGEFASPQTSSPAVARVAKPKLASSPPGKRDAATSCPDEDDLALGRLLHFCSLANHCRFCALKLGQAGPQQQTQPQLQPQPYQIAHHHHHHHPQQPFFAHHHQMHPSHQQHQQPAPPPPPAAQTQTQLHQHHHQAAYYQAANSSFYHQATASGRHHPIYQQQARSTYVQLAAGGPNISPPSTGVQSPASTPSSATPPAHQSYLSSPASASPSSHNQLVMQHASEPSLLNYHYHAHAHHQLHQTPPAPAQFQPLATTQAIGRACCCPGDPVKQHAGDFQSQNWQQAAAPATFDKRSAEETSLQLDSPAGSSCAPATSLAAPQLHLMEPLQQDRNNNLMRLSSHDSKSLACDLKTKSELDGGGKVARRRASNKEKAEGDGHEEVGEEPAHEEQVHQADRKGANYKSQQQSISRDDASQSQDCQRPVPLRASGDTTPSPAAAREEEEEEEEDEADEATAAPSALAIPASCTLQPLSGSYVTCQNELFSEPATSELEIRARVERLNFSDTEKQLIFEMIDATRLVFEVSERLTSKANDSPLDDIVLFCDEALRRLIKTVKQINAFRMLSMDDQIVLLKNACFKILLLRSSLHYHDDIEGWRDKSGGVMPMKALRTPKCNNYELHKEIMEKLAVPLRRDRLVMAFLIMVILFDPTANLKHSNSVGLDNLVYLCILRKYLTGFQPDPLAKYERIVEALQVVNACNEEYNMFFSKNYQPEQITPLLIEIFDISINESP